MATTKEIKNRINSVRDTQKITNAMYLIASSKMAKAKKALEATTPFFSALRREGRRIMSAQEGVSSLYIFDEKEKKLDENSKYAYLVLTADKGLAGAHNQNIIRETIARIGNSENYEIEAIGEYGRNFFKSHGYHLAEDFFFADEEPTLDRARRINEYLLQKFEDGRISKIFVVYSHFKNAMTGGEVRTMELLPFEKQHFYQEKDAQELDTNFEFVPSAESVLNGIIRSYMIGLIYSAQVNSFCSEQAARMTAMDAANNNAEDLLEELSMEYNHVRQGTITNEITEISSGARSLRQNAKLRAEREAAN